MQTKFYWISFLVLGFGQRSDFPSECALSAEGGGEECRAQTAEPRRKRAREGTQRCPRSALLLLFPDRFLIPSFLFPRLHPSSHTSLISFPSLLFLSSTSPQSPLPMHFFTPTPPCVFFLFFFSFAITVICNIRRGEI